MPRSPALLNPVHVRAAFLSRVVHSTEGCFHQRCSFLPWGEYKTQMTSRQGTAPSSLAGHCPKEGEHGRRHPRDQRGIPRQHKLWDSSALAKPLALHHSYTHQGLLPSQAAPKDQILLPSHRGGWQQAPAGPVSQAALELSTFPPPGNLPQP